MAQLQTTQRLALVAAGLVAAMLIGVVLWVLCFAQTTVLLVRHADRVPGEDALSAAGLARAQGVEVDANVFYTIFGPKGMTLAQTAYWDAVISRAMQSEQLTKDTRQNYWTIGLIGHLDLPGFLNREIENYRRALAEIGLM